MSAGIYLIINKINNHKYIGKAKDIKNRWYHHLYEARKKGNKAYNYPLSKAIRKYGIENFDLIILENINQIEYDNISSEKERYWIAKYNTFNNRKDYNQTQGGEGICGIKKPHTKEWKQKHSERMKGFNNPQYGKHSNGKQVICVETQQIFPSGRAAAEWLGLSAKAVNEAIREGWKAGGYTWQRI